MRIWHSSSEGRPECRGYGHPLLDVAQGEFGDRPDAADALVGGKAQLLGEAEAVDEIPEIRTRFISGQAAVLYEPIPISPKAATCHVDDNPAGATVMVSIVAVASCVASWLVTASPTQTAPASAIVS